jgi:hypothetical protein
MTSDDKLSAEPKPRKRVETGPPAANTYLLMQRVIVTAAFPHWRVPGSGWSYALAGTPVAKRMRPNSPSLTTPDTLPWVPGLIVCHRSKQRTLTTYALHFVTPGEWGAVPQSTLRILAPTTPAEALAALAALEEFAQKLWT